MRPSPTITATSAASQPAGGMTAQATPARKAARMASPLGNPASLGRRASRSTTRSCSSNGLALRARSLTALVTPSAASAATPRLRARAGWNKATAASASRKKGVVPSRRVTARQRSTTAGACAVLRRSISAASRPRGAGSNQSAPLRRPRIPSAAPPSTPATALRADPHREEHQPLVKVLAHNRFDLVQRLLCQPPGSVLARAIRLDRSARRRSYGSGPGRWE